MCIYIKTITKKKKLNLRGSDTGIEGVKGRKGKGGICNYILIKFLKMRNYVAKVLIGFKAHVCLVWVCTHKHKCL